MIIDITSILMSKFFLLVIFSFLFYIFISAIFFGEVWYEKYY